MTVRMATMEPRTMMSRVSGFISVSMMSAAIRNSRPEQKVVAEAPAQIVAKKFDIGAASGGVFGAEETRQADDGAEDNDEDAEEADSKAGVAKDFDGLVHFNRRG
jgi:hypothetical protein